MAISHILAHFLNCLHKTKEKKSVITELFFVHQLPIFSLCQIYESPRHCQTQISQRMIVTNASYQFVFVIEDCLFCATFEWVCHDV